MRRWRRHALAARRLKRDEPLWLKRYGREAAVELWGMKSIAVTWQASMRGSAWRSGDLISSVRDRYETIVEELLAVRYVQRDGRRYWLARCFCVNAGVTKQ